MRQLVSVLVVLLGVLHVVSEVLANRSELVDLARRGVGGLPSAPDSQSSAFYSVLFGVLAAAAGQVMFSTAVRHGTMSMVPGVVLVGVGAAGAWLAPRSPFWGAIVVGVLVVVAARRPPDQVRPQGRVATTGPTA